MKKLKSEKGAITIIVLVSVLFFVSFLISSYVIIANKVQTQKEIIAETKKIYEPKNSMEYIYNSYFNNDEVIPIYTVEQLLAIGEEEKQINIDGKYYTFTNDSSYVLKNDLEFSAIDLELEEDWVAINSNNSTFEGEFEGNGHTIAVTNLDGSNTIYSELNNYGEFSARWIISEEIQEEWDGNIIALTDGEEVIPLPKGFYISGKSGEDIIEEGLVITDKNKNEFVWIPIENAIIDISDKIKTIDNITTTYGNNSWELVKNAIIEQVDLTSGIYPMTAKIGEEGEEHYIGISYLFDKNGNINDIGTLNGTATYVEPRAVTGEYDYKTGKNYDAIYTNILMAMTDEEISEVTINQNSTAEECSTYFYNKLQNDFDEMIKSVIKYGGFYIGRYETTGFNNETVTIKPEENYSNINNNWYTMYKKQKEFSNSINANSIESSMIWGCQYDQVMQYVNGKFDGNGDIYNVGSAGTRKSRDEVIGTGYTKSDKVLNIFDLEGCRSEATVETNGRSSRISRGGKYNNDYPASYRSNYNLSSQSDETSRIVLYIK